MFSWSFSNKKNRSSSWYIIASIAAISFIIFGIVSQLYLLSVVVVLLIGTFILIENNDAEATQVNIDEYQITIGGTKYFWWDFSQFSVVVSEWHAVFLRLIPKRKIATVLTIPFSVEVNVLELREFLLNILPEDTNNELTGVDALLFASKI